ncbi:uncharacterized protein LOC116610674 [Nematostella vectensis]|uniref:uncharacterized protein LOC116610674 n=1 Tax=Nematostella vectensis TaxID=45351 RepID=UPI00207714F7|nr:uncharacterized protein LOC116610674 [Nematostella vectensis]
MKCHAVPDTSPFPGPFPTEDLTSTPVKASKSSKHTLTQTSKKEGQPMKKVLKQDATIELFQKLQDLCIQDEGQCVKREDLMEVLGGHSKNLVTKSLKAVFPLCQKKRIKKAGQQITYYMNITFKQKDAVVPLPIESLEDEMKARLCKLEDRMTETWQLILDSDKVFMK